MTEDLIVAKLVESIPYVVGGVIAFAGGIGGHFLNHWLTISHRKQERLQDQLLSLVESIQADEEWLERYRVVMCFGIQDMNDPGPISKIEVIQLLYFPALSAERRDYEVARSALVQAILKVRAQRLDDSRRHLNEVKGVDEALSMSRPKQNLINDVLNGFKEFWERKNSFIGAAAKISHDQLKLK